jgi:hypothetical protein
MDMPLFVDGVAVGRLHVSGERDRNGGVKSDAVDRLPEFIKQFESAFVELTSAPLIGKAVNHGRSVDRTLAGSERSVSKSLASSVI